MNRVESLLSEEEFFTRGNSLKNVYSAARSAGTVLKELSHSGYKLFGGNCFDGFSSLKPEERDFILYSLSFLMNEIISSTDCFLGEVCNSLESSELSFTDRLHVVQASEAVFQITSVALLYICKAVCVLKGEDLSQVSDFISSDSQISI